MEDDDKTCVIDKAGKKRRTRRTQLPSQKAKQQSNEKTRANSSERGIWYLHHRLTKKRKKQEVRNFGFPSSTAPSFGEIETSTSQEPIPHSLSK
jgi:hypothetical protein